MSVHSLPLFVRVAGRPVILLGEGEAADAKRRLLERAGAAIVGEDAAAALAIVAIDDEPEALAAVARLKARGLLVNAVDRPSLCDFTLPAIVDRDPVLVAIGTGGVSAGLAAALRQRLEALLPAGLGTLADTLFALRDRLRTTFPDDGERRRALAAAMSAGGGLDPLGAGPSMLAALVEVQRSEAAERLMAADGTGPGGSVTLFRLVSTNPDDLTLRQARALASADRVLHTARVPVAILDRARADAPRILSPEPPRDRLPGSTVWLEMAS